MQWSDVPATAVAIFRACPERIEAHYRTKQAESPTLDRLGQFLQLWPGHTVPAIPNSPAPLASMLVGGLAGAGLGYGAGALGEQLLPAGWHRRRLRRTLAALGGAAGASPGALWGLTNAFQGKSFNDAQTSAKLVPEPPGAVSGHFSYGSLPKQLPESLQADFDHAFKAADYGITGAYGNEGIDVDAMNRIIWSDPRVAGPLSPPLQAAASGLLTGAANLSGRNSGWVTPMAVGRMAAGMGAGYLAGTLVGRGLGILAGMPEETQERLKNTGAYAGLLSVMIPAAFGIR